MQAHIVGDVVELLTADIVQPLAAFIQLFVDLHSFLGHLLMSFISAPHERKVLSFGDSFVTIGVQTYSKRHGFGGIIFPWRMCHLPDPNNFTACEQVETS